MESEIAPVDVLNRTTKIVMLAMAIVMVSVSVVAVIIALNERDTQSNANFFIRQNQELQDELQCLRPAALDYDRAVGSIQIHIAEGLAAISEGEDILDELAAQLRADAIAVEDAVKAREASVTKCSNDPTP